jgi:hypothetical protein
MGWITSAGTRRVRLGLVLMACGLGVLAVPSPGRARQVVSWGAPTLVDPPTVSNAVFSAISCPSSGFCVAGGYGQVATSAAPATGATSWTVADVNTSHQIVGMSCPTASLCVGVDSGGNVVSSSDPTGGTSAWIVGPVSASAFTAISCPSTSLCVATGNGFIASSTNPAGGAPTWTVSQLAGQDLGAALSCPTSTLCVGADGSSVITATNPAGGASAWTTTPVSTADGLDTISCPSASLCVAAGLGGDVVTTAHPTGGTAAWTDTRLAEGEAGCDKYSCPPGEFTNVSCPSTSHCLVVEKGGAVTTTADPTGGANAWTVFAGVISVDAQVSALSCTADAFCAAAGGNAVYTTTTADAATPAWAGAFDAAAPTGFTGVSCPSPAVCIAVDGEGNVATSPDATGGGWHVVHVDVSFAGLTGVSCPTVSFCATVDSAGDVLTSTDPSGGGSTWAIAHVDGIAASVPGWPVLTGISCASPTLCVAVDGGGDVVTSANPTGGAGAWTLTHVNTTPVTTLDSVSCPTTSFCVLGGWSGRVLTSTDPTGGPGAWLPATIDTSEFNIMYGVSCPSVSFCATIDGSGNVFVSHHSAGGAKAWSHAKVGSVGVAISCPSSSLCAGVFDPGELAASADPAGGAGTWTSSGSIVKPINASAVACPSVAECIAVDGRGELLVGVPAPPPTAGEIRAALRRGLAPSGKTATTKSVLKRGGYVMIISPLTAGRVTITWSEARKTGGRRRFALVARGTAEVTTAPDQRVKITLTRAGRALFKRHRSVRLTLSGTFATAGRTAITAQRTAVL